MRKLPVVALTLLLAASSGASAQTQTIDFENIPPAFVSPGPYSYIVGNYAGFVWSAGDFNRWLLITAGQPQPIAPSLGRDASRPSSGITDVTLGLFSWDTFSRPGDPFTLNSIFLGETVSPLSTNRKPTNIFGYLNGVQLFSASIIASATTIDKYEFNWEGIDEVAFDIEDPGMNIIIDDITVTSTPEPGTLALLGLGCPAFLFLRKRIRRSRHADGQNPN
jgi:hypothetical protein